jgi:hypothetical protein
MSKAKREEQRLDKIAEVMRVAAEINLKTERAVFVRFYGHVESMDIEVCRCKVGGYNVKDFQTEIELNKKPTAAQFDKIINRLKRFLVEE